MMTRHCTIVALSAVISGQAAIAAPLISYVSQERSVHADANWSGGTSLPPDLLAPDFLPFGASVSAGGGSASSSTFALAGASQTSSFGADGNIQFRGTADVDMLADFGEFASAGSASRLHVVVDVLSVASNQWGFFDAMFSGFGGFDTGTLSLTGPGVAINESFGLNNFGISGIFFVSPGRYELTVTVSSAEALSDGIFFQGGAGLIVAVGIPAPGALGVGALAVAAFLRRGQRHRGN